MDAKSDDMEDKNQDGGDQGQGGEGGTKRRRRGDAGERNYTCGCGKSYLSYPALYTHIKTKHNGVTPAGTSQPQTNGKSGRGRPKKEDSIAKSKEDDKAEPADNQEAQIANERVINYLTSLGEQVFYNSQNEGSNSIILDDMDTFDLVAKFPTNVLQPQDYINVFREFETIYRAKNIGPEEIDRDSGLKKTTMNKVFAIFIYTFGRRLSEEFYREFVFFLMMYRRALNEIGWATKYEVTKTAVTDAERRSEFCAISNGEFALDICNDFITDKWSEYLSQYNLTGFKVLGLNTEMTKNAVFLTQHFCNWLNAQRYTNTRLQINDEDQ